MQPHEHYVVAERLLHGADVLYDELDQTLIDLNGGESGHVPFGDVAAALRAQRDVISRQLDATLNRAQVHATLATAPRPPRLRTTEEDE